MSPMTVLRIADLFSGIGGIRLGFENACKSLGVQCECVYSCDINKNAAKVYRSRFQDDHDPLGDITKVENFTTLPDVDVVLAGFPCVSFSIAGGKKGFDEARGTLFFHLAKLIASKRPMAFLFENVDNLKRHDRGRTFRTIMNILTDDLNYGIHHAILNSKDFGVPQNRKRIYIVGFRNGGGGFVFPKPTDSSKRLSDIVEKEPVDPKYYLSQRYLDALNRHKDHHKGKGQGFGYLIKKPTDVASTVLCGGMGKERNLLIDTRTVVFSSRKTLVNSDHIRVMTPTEWERLQGFPPEWTSGVPDGVRMDLLGNSVTVPVIEAISLNIVKELRRDKPIPYCDQHDPLFA